MENLASDSKRRGTLSASANAYPKELFPIKSLAFLMIIASSRKSLLS